MDIDRYIYVLTDLYFLGLVAVIFWKRSDLRKLILKSGIAGGIIGLLSELWYFKDYWTPPSFFGNTILSPEDFFFGFCIVALGCTGYVFVTSKKLIKTYPARKKTFILIALLSVLALILGTTYLHLNSIYVSCIFFVSSAIYMSIYRHDLFRPSITNGVLLMLLVIPLYLFLIHISPNYVARYSILDHHGHIPEIHGIPFTELLWYLTWGKTLIN